MVWRIECADVLDWCESYRGEKFHCILTDPSYVLSKKKPVNRDAPANLPPDATLGDVIDAYHSIMQWGDVGFMHARWDHDLPFSPFLWESLAKHLHPGGFILAFASSRGWHRLACAMEDAGLVLQPSIFMYGWLNSQSFPKSTKICAQLDARAGVEQGRELRPIAYPDSDCWGVPNRNATGGCRNPTSYDPGVEKIAAQDGMRWHSVPVTDLAQAWAGHRYGGQVLKDCLNPIVCAQKPWGKNRLDDIVSTGAGALWVDGGRIATGDSEPNARRNKNGDEQSSWFHTEEGIRQWTGNQGRWPPNFALIHNPPSPCDCTDAPACPHCHGAGLVGGCVRVGVKRVQSAGWRDNDGAGEPQPKMYGGYAERKRKGYADSDGLETTEAWHCTQTCANHHHWRGETRGPCPECGAAGEWSCPVAALGEQGGERKSSAILPEPIFYGKDYEGWGSIGDHKKSGYADDGSCTRFFPQFAWSYEVAEQLAGAAAVRYCSKAGRRERNAGCEELPLRERNTQGRDTVRVIDRKDGKGPVPVNAQIRPAQNFHPTVKPISLLVWLATLLLPPEEYAPRRILVPFSGSGSECIGALLAGFEYIVGIDSESSYCDIARARLRWWQGWAEAGHSEPRAILKEARKRERAEAKERQMEMGL